MKKLSRKRLIANRKNAQRSTGPVSPEGKSRAALNALDHGLCAMSTLLPGESDSRFRALLTGFEEDFDPQSSVARFQVEQLAVAAWRLRRSQAFEVALVRDHLSTIEVRPDDNAATVIARAWAGSRAALALRYENSHQRNFRHTYDRLMALHESGPDPDDLPERNEATAAEAPSPAGGPATAPASSNQPVAGENAFLRNEANAGALPAIEGRQSAAPTP